MQDKDNRENVENFSENNEINDSATESQSDSVDQTEEIKADNKKQINKKTLSMILIWSVVAVVVGVSIFLGVYFSRPAKVITVYFYTTVETVDSMEVKQGETPSLPVLTRDGYIFLGWFTQDNVLADDGFFRSYDYSEDLELRAGWEIIDPVTVTFNAKGGSSVEPKTVPSGYTLEEMGQTSRSGFSLLGWCFDEQCLSIYDPSKDVIDQDTTLYAKWIKSDISDDDIITVVYRSNMGSAISDKIVKLGQVFTSEKPHRTGYDFLGWFSDSDLKFKVDDGVLLTQSCVVYAKWATTPVTCEITFVSPDGAPEKSPELFAYDYEITARAIQAPDWAGYDFVGYYYDRELTSRVSLPFYLQENITLYLSYTPSVVEFVDVYFVVDSQTSSTSLRKGSLVAYWEPIKEDAVFEGWYLDAAFTTKADFDNLFATENLTLYAKWILDAKYADDAFIYELSEDGKYLIVAYETDANKALQKISIPDTCNGLPIQEIKEGLFYGRYVTDVTIGKNIKSISKGAFENSYLENIVLPSNVVEIKEEAFKHAYNLKTVQALGAVTIGEYAFQNCETLSTFTANYAIKVASHAFDSSMVQEVSMIYLQELGEYVFYNCKRLNTVDISQSAVTEIGMRVFENCSALSQVKLSSRTKSLKDFSFSHSGLTSFDTGSLEKIGYNVFDSCKYLQTVTIRSPLLSIESSAFINCTSLASFICSNSDFTTYQDDGCLYNGNYTSLLLIPANRTTYYLPKEVTSLSVQAFSLASKIENITVDDDNQNYKSIDGNLYSKDGKTLVYYASGKSAEQFVLPDGVTTLQSICFNNSASLKTVVLTQDVVSVNYWAFYDMPSLERIVCPTQEIASLINVSTSEADSICEVYACPNATVTVG